MNNIHEVDFLLAEVFGRYSQEWQPADPLVELIETVLRHRTTNTHAARAMASLQGGCPTWAAVVALPHDVLADLIRPAGLARQKAGSIRGILERIYQDTGDYSLAFLAEMETPAATRYLRTLPGVGAHTAALVLLFALGRHGVMPVDGHVHRVARRLGWAPEGATANAVQRAVEGAAPTANLMDLHVNLIRLGHRTCTEGTPDCRDCPLNELCGMALRQPW
jgi:endonuclease-3